MRYIENVNLGNYILAMLLMLIEKLNPHDEVVISTRRDFQAYNLSFRMKPPFDGKGIEFMEIEPDKQYSHKKSEIIKINSENEYG